MKRLSNLKNAIVKKPKTKGQTAEIVDFKKAVEEADKKGRAVFYKVVDNNLSKINYLTTNYTN